MFVRRKDLFQMADWERKLISRSIVEVSPMRTNLLVVLLAIGIRICPIALAQQFVVPPKIVPGQVQPAISRPPILETVYIAPNAGMPGRVTVES